MKVVLLVMDGWGLAPKSERNAISQAKTPNFERLWKEYLHCEIKASGGAVGLPEGYQGNSEVGHITMGSGRIVCQSLMRINKSIEEGDFFGNPGLLKAVENCRKNRSAMHLMGLVQDQGVHAHERHLYALLELCRRKGIENVPIHFFSDGRDTPPKSALACLERLERVIEEKKVGKIATVTGRYYAMDRDNRWERTEVAYRGIAEAKGKKEASAREAIGDAYREGEKDEFIKPRIIGDYKGIKENDSVVFFNYRLDRARQLTRAFVDDGFNGFRRELPKVHYTCMTRYYKEVTAGVAFDEIKIGNTLGEVVSAEGLKQLRISETEKYAHVTFFFNAQREEPSKGEERFLVPSPKVATYDMKPEMSAYEVTEKLVGEIKGNKFDFILCNLVNCDMVGHTGKKDAVIRAIEVVDDCLGKVADAAKESGYALVVTADHGNAEDIGVEGNPKTAHTTNNVPLILVSEEPKGKKPGGGLKDIAPTVLKLMGIEKPSEMTGKALFG